MKVLKWRNLVFELWLLFNSMCVKLVTCFPSDVERGVSTTMPPTPITTTLPTAKEMTTTENPEELTGSGEDNADPNSTTTEKNPPKEVNERSSSKSTNETSSESEDGDEDEEDSDVDDWKGWKLVVVNIIPGMKIGNTILNFTQSMLPKVFTRLLPTNFKETLKWIDKYL